MAGQLQAGRCAGKARGRSFRCHHDFVVGTARCAVRAAFSGAIGHVLDRPGPRFNPLYADSDAAARRPYLPLAVARCNRVSSVRRVEFGVGFIGPSHRHDILSDTLVVSAVRAPEAVAIIESVKRAIENSRAFRHPVRVKLARILFGPLLAALLLAGCHKPAATAPTSLQDPDEPHAAQPKLQTVKLWLGPAELNAELAVTGRQMQTGMMFRTNMAESDAMLFAFPQPFQAAFWMKNTVLPLSAAYIDPSGTILEIHNLQPQDTNSVVAASDNIQFVLETKQGWFGRHNVSTGAVVRTENGSLMDMYRGR